jgi:ribosome-associated protein
MTNQLVKVLEDIGQTIFDKKGFNILSLDVRGVSTITDYFIIAEGTVDRHVKALANSVIEKLEEHGEKPFRVEGEKNGDWIVIDCGDIVVHLFMAGLREKYSLENIWKEGKIVDLHISTSPLKEEVL